MTWMHDALEKGREMTMKALVQTRIDAALKEEVDKVLKPLCLHPGIVIRAVFTQIARERKLPDNLFVPKAVKNE
jgi:addiction module RelB/DinJ family antitoxin